MSVSTPPRRKNAPVSVPLPNSVQLFHLSLDANGNDKSVSKYFRPEHSVALLHRIRLDLMCKEEGDEKTIYSRETPTACLRPSWLHLASDVEGLTAAEYESLTLRLYNDSNHCFMDLPVHPSKLVQIAGMPKVLPRNGLVVQYSDDSIRVSTSLYQILMEGPERNNMRLKISEDDEGWFKDTTFDVLDQVSPVRKLSLLDSDTAETNGSNGLESAFSSLPLRDDEIDSEDEIQRLQILVQREEDLLQHEVQELETLRTSLSSILDSERTLRRRTLEVRAAEKEEQEMLRKSRLALLAQRIHLVQALRAVYPISIQNNICKIRGLTIPSQIFTIGEDELAAALGFLCHLVFMLSKYLNVALRYRLFSNSSRSAVQDDQAVLYPLFLSRMARDQVMKAVSLLRADVACIAEHFDFALDPNDHVLIQTKKLMEAFCYDGFL